MLSVKTILYVENDAVSQTLYQKRLEHEGFHIECAQDGQMALDILSERTPDLVLLDLMLPKVNGADVLKFMHADPRLTTVPVIVFSNAPLTEVPPDDPLAQGTRRLLKSDCTFPMLLGAIQEALAHEPELVVVEVGKSNAGSPSNGDRRRHGAAVAVPNSDNDPLISKRRSEFLKEARGMIPKIREQSMGYIKAPNEKASQAYLSGLHQRVQLLNSSAAQSGCARVGLLTNAFNALLCGIMEKPETVTPSALQSVAQAVDCLDTLLKNKDGYSTGPAFRAKLLVVDDDTVCNHVNVNSLKRANFEAIGINDPAAALSMLETTAFDLVVMDVNMPGMTGFDICEKMRRLPHCKNTPVVFVTAFSNFDNRKQSVLSGGNDFVSKPISPLELALKVTVNLIKARATGVDATWPQTHSMSTNNDNGSANAVQPPSHAPDSSSRNGGQSPGISARTAPGLEPKMKDGKLAAPLRMAEPGAEDRPRVSGPAVQSKIAVPTPANPNSVGNRDMDMQNRLQQSSAALECAKASLEQEAKERTRMESQWREQLSTAEALVKQAETSIKEKDVRCTHLQNELNGVRREREELQNKLATEQQSAAKTRQEFAELKTNLEKLSAERARSETELREQLNAAKTAATKNATVLQERESRCGQLEKELAGLRQTRDELQRKFTAEQQTAAKTEQEAKQLKANVEKLSAERARQEKEWQEQLNAAKAAAARSETALQEKKGRCERLEKEVGGLQLLRDELQNKLAAGQQAVTKAQKTAQESEERLLRSNAELERVKTDIQKLSVERSHTETELREQLNAARTATARAEATLSEKVSQNNRLEKELAEAQQARTEFQNQLTAEQRQTAKGRQEIKELQERLNHGAADLERARSSLEQEITKRTHLDSECKNLLQAKEALGAELQEVRNSRSARETQWHEQQRKLADGLRENIRLLQSRLRETEGSISESREISSANPQPR